MKKSCISSGVFLLSSMYTATTLRKTGILQYTMTSQSNPKSMATRIPAKPIFTVSTAASRYRGMFVLINSQSMSAPLPFDFVLMPDFA